MTVPEKRRFVPTLFLVAVLWALARPVAAASAPRYLTLDHWAYEGIALLHQAGYLPGLNPLVQPYPRAEVAREVAELDPGRLPEPLAHWARLLREEFGTAEPSAASGRVSWGTWLEAGARASTSGRVDPLRPCGDDAHAWPYGRVSGWVTARSVAAELTLREDTYLADDPDGLDPQRRVGRSETAYLAAAVPFGTVAVGRFARNWSRLGTRGLLVSDAATPYPQIGITFGAGRFTLRSFLGELDSLPDPADSLGSYKRYLAAHRVDLAWPNLVLSFGESVLLASRGGGISLRHLNPVELFYSDADAPPEDLVQNLMLDVQAWARRGRFELFGEALLDDVDITPPKGADREPTSYAVTVGARWTHASGTRSVGLEYARVSAWAYRTPNRVDRYSYLDRGLGENASDWERMTLRVDWLGPWPGLRLTPLVAVRRSGRGDFRDPVPPEPEYLGSPNLFLGTRETTVRVALGGRYQPDRRFWLAWNAGPDFFTNRDHVQGADETSFSASVEAGLRFSVFPPR